MTQTVIFLVEVTLVLAAFGWLLTERVRSDRLALRRRVVVNLVGGQAVEAVLYARRGRLLVLRDAHLHEPGAQPVTVDGEMVLDRDRVEFIQVPGGP